MTLADISTSALFITSALYASLGIGFALRGQWSSMATLYALALLALIGALI
jgi:hypothetical protein